MPGLVRKNALPTHTDAKTRVIYLSPVYILDTFENFGFFGGGVLRQPLLEQRPDPVRQAYQTIASILRSGLGSSSDDSREFVIRQPGDDRSHHDADRHAGVRQGSNRCQTAFGM